jgi:hypothetical protein
MKPGTLLCAKKAYENSMDPDRIFALVLRRHSRSWVDVLWCTREIQRMCLSELFRYKAIA